MAHCRRAVKHKSLSRQPGGRRPKAKTILLEWCLTFIKPLFSSIWVYRLSFLGPGFGWQCLISGAFFVSTIYQRPKSRYITVMRNSRMMHSLFSVECAMFHFPSFPAPRRPVPSAVPCHLTSRRPWSAREPATTTSKFTASTWTGSRSS